MTSRKRGREEMEEASTQPEEDPTLHRLRNMWEFANLMQYIFIFGEAVKIDKDLGIEDLEQECLKPEASTVLLDIGLALLKFVSSHRGLTPEIFEEYTRRQYLKHHPELNPFGDEEEPTKFNTLDTFTKIRVLTQLSQWTFVNADRLRERMAETKDAEQIAWRIEEIGYDKQDRLYFVLDDNRLYRRTDPPLPPPPAAKPKANSKKAHAAARATKKRKTRQSMKEDAEEEEQGDDAADESKVEDEGEQSADLKWECLAITLPEYHEFLSTIQKSRDPNEKALHKRIVEQVLPVIDKAEEALQRKKQKQERELQSLQKMATAKRSSRLEAKFEREKQDQVAAEEQKKRQEELKAAKLDQERQKRMDADRQSRMLTREMRLKDREYKRILHEEELAKLAEEERKVEAGESRGSERHLKSEIKKAKVELDALHGDGEDDWDFDCAKCGKFGKNWDDGTHSVACEGCDVWQHSACLGITKEDAEKEEFHFICARCKQQREDALKPKIPPLKLSTKPTSPSSQKKANGMDATPQGTKRKKPESKSGLPPTKRFKVPGQPDQKVNGVVSANQNRIQGQQAALNGSTSIAPAQNGAAMPLFAGNAASGPTASLAHTPGYARKNKPKPETSPSGISSNHFTSASTPNAHASPYGHPYQNGYYLPSLQSPIYPAVPPHYSAQHAQQGAQWQSQQYPAAYGSLQNGQYAGSGQSTPAAPQHPQQHPQQRPQQHSSYAQQQSPFTNSFGRQPVTHHPNPQIPPPLRNGPALSPPQQHRSPPAVNGVHPQAQLHTPQPNGLANGYYGAAGQQTFTPHAAAVPNPSPAAHSPVKHPSPATSFTQPASLTSPIANQPPLKPTNAPATLGVSPEKHGSPPQQPPPVPAHQSPTVPAVLSPVPKLAPSPSQTAVTAAATDAVPSKSPITSPWVNENIKPAPVPTLLPSPMPAQSEVPAPVKSNGIVGAEHENGAVKMNGVATADIAQETQSQ